MKPYLDLCRISNLPTVWTNVLTASVVSAPGFRWSDYFVLSLSMSLFYLGGMCLNDLCDLKGDRVQKPFRPLPSNRISIRSARLFTALLFGMGLALLLFLPFSNALYPGFLLLAMIVIYDKIHKKTPMSVFLMAGCRLLVFVLSAVSLTGTFGGYALVAGLLQFLYVLVLSVVARHENTLPKGFSFPVIPWMLACICLLDGIVMAVVSSPIGLLAGISGMALTRLGQRYIRGD